MRFLHIPGEYNESERLYACFLPCASDVIHPVLWLVKGCAIARLQRPDIPESDTLYHTLTCLEKVEGLAPPQGMKPFGILRRQFSSHIRHLVSGYLHCIANFSERILSCELVLADNISVDWSSLLLSIDTSPPPFQDLQAPPYTSGMCKVKVHASMVFYTGGCSLSIRR